MEISELTNEELTLFLTKGISIKNLRNIYAKNNSLAKKIRGFRVQTANEQVLITTSINLIRRPKDNNLLLILKSYMEDFVDSINTSIENMMADGWDPVLAKATALKDAINDDFRPLYNKLQGISEEEQQELEAALNRSSQLTTQIDSRIADAIAKLKTEIGDDHRYDDAIRSLETTLRSEISELQKELKIVSDGLGEVDSKASAIPEGCVTKSEVEAMIFDSASAMDRRMHASLSTTATATRVFELESKIDDLTKLIRLQKTEKKKTAVLVSERTITDYESFDEYLKDNIGDVIEKVTTQDTFDAFREYLTEIIFSNKPVIAPKESSDILADILSSIVTGGNYFTITLDNTTTNSELIETIDGLNRTSGNLVVLIKNIDYARDFQNLTALLSSRPFNEKFIFEIYFDKEIKYLPKETISRCEYFCGRLKKGPIDFRYAYSFTDSKRVPFKNGLYSQSLEALEVYREDRTVYTQNTYGILAYSIIPFLALNEDADTDELITKLPDSNLRAKCKAVLDD